MDTVPKLSICIPTFNRAHYLEQCLSAIVQQDRFEEIEVVISDNCSTDDTEQVGRRYDNRYSNIHYYRNDENVRDMNFYLAFRRAAGRLRKLTNDTVIYKPGAVKYMLQAAEENLETKPQIYFLSNGHLSGDKKTVSSLDDYVGTIKHYLTWIRSLAVWDEDCEDLDVMVTKADSQMAQVSFLLENFEKRGRAVIYDKEIMDGLHVKKKNLAYGLYKVFYESFLGVVKPYVEEGKLSSSTYEELRKDLLLNFFCEWIVNRETESDDYIFSDEELQKLVEDTYRSEPYFNDYKKKARLLRLKKKIKHLVKKD